MTFTLLPSIKGQLMIPLPLRKKYKISKETPLQVEDQGNGVISLKVMNLIDFNDIQYFENEKEVSLSFPKGVSPQVLIDKINELDK